MSKIDSLISDVETVLEKLGEVHNRLKELKEDAGAVENARDRLRGRKPKKSDKSH
jgi:ElaB/YqjD/DUF883 family membrane-anchored ribosome-binding protein